MQVERVLSRVDVASALHRHEGRGGEGRGGVLYLKRAAMSLQILQLLLVIFQVGVQLLHLASPLLKLTAKLL